MEIKFNLRVYSARRPRDHLTYCTEFPRNSDNYNQVNLEMPPRTQYWKISVITLEIVTVKTNSPAVFL